jgi:CubicO group peptidase (beta-lactamase class C family)
VTGQDIHTLIQQRVFKPLAMGDTALVAPASDKGSDRMGSSFKWSGKQGFCPIPQGGRFDASHGRPRAVGGSAYSTAIDMAK